MSCNQGKCIYVGWRAGRWDTGLLPLITLGRQRSSTALSVNAQSGPKFLEIDSTGSPGKPDKGPDHQAAKVLFETTGVCRAEME